MNLTVDLGNTYAKTGLFQEKNLTEVQWRLPFDDLLAYVARVRPKRLLISSVSRSEDELRTRLTPLVPQVYVMNPQLPVPLTKDYETPQTLGADRVAAAVGARVVCPEASCLVIDMGTCITYDFIDNQDIFYGGLISPGMRMRFRAMHSFTQRLPDLEADGVVPTLIGKNTRHAMQSGVMNGLLAELNGIITEYRSLMGDFQTIVCGGDARFFESRFQTPIFAVPELVLVGLNRILQHNVHLLSN